MSKGKLTSSELDALSLSWAFARRDPVDFLRFFCLTLDQHDKHDSVKPFPAERPHLVALTRLWQHNRLLSICKSRQMVCTWLFAALALWDALMHPGRLIML